MKKINMLRISVIILAILALAFPLWAEITYTYTAEQNPIWLNGKHQGDFYAPDGTDTSLLSHLKLVRLGVLHIAGLPQNTDSGTTFMIVTPPASSVRINGTFIFHNGTTVQQFYDKMENDINLGDNTKAVVKLVGQYYPKGVRTSLDLSSGGNREIDLTPPWNKDSLDMEIYLVIGESLKMVNGASYYVYNVSNYIFRLEDENHNEITGEGINNSNNPFTGGNTNPTWTGTDGAVQPANLRAYTSLLGYPDKNPLGKNPVMELPSSMQELMSGVNLAYLRINFDTDNGNAGATKDLVVTLSHDKLKASGIAEEYEYGLAVEHDSKTGTVTTTAITSGFSTEDRSYRLENSSAGDTDTKLLKFRFESNAFSDAQPGQYSSTIRIELSVHE
ncbi:MAG: hypothetical protein ACFN3H_01405 [Spirochaetales bacterium]